MLWSKATPEERKDIMASLFGEVRVRDKAIVSATIEGVDVLVMELLAV